MSKTLPRRKNPRLPGYDYRSAGAYFVTICTAGRQRLFGAVDGDTVISTPLGQVVESVWDQISVDHPGGLTDAFVLMPNHIHGIIVLTQTGAMNPGAMNRAPTGGGDDGGVSQDVATDAMNPGAMNRAPTPTLGQIVRAFKARVSRQATVDGLVGGDVWQRGYHDRIIRDDAELTRIRLYIANNPLNWSLDPNNLDHRGAIHGARPLRDRLPDTRRSPTGNREPQ